MAGSEKKRFLVILAAVVVLYGWVNRPVATSVAWGHDFRAARAASQESGRSVLLAFESSGCGYCTLMDREVLSDPQIERELGRFEAVRVDMFHEPGLARLYEVEAVPAFVVLSSDGRPILKTTGYQPVADFKRFLRRAVAESQP